MVMAPTEVLVQHDSGLSGNRRESSTAGQRATCEFHFSYAGRAILSLASQTLIQTRLQRQHKHPCAGNHGWQRSTTRQTGRTRHSRTSADEKAGSPELEAPPIPLCLASFGTTDPPATCKSQDPTSGLRTNRRRVQPLPLDEMGSTTFSAVDRHYQAGDAAWPQCICSRQFV